ncbi:YciC family protein [Candidatus Ishikawella capsulata]|uniref:YciC family protein n=1 Tax=Candidatus Ishikawella capsulata TaxID=168169 RepID=UPI00387E9FCC
MYPTFFVHVLVIAGATLFIVPGILLFMLLSLSPIILIKTKYGIITTIKDSIRISWKNLKLIILHIISFGLANLIISVLLACLFLEI